MYIIYFQYIQFFCPACTFIMLNCQYSHLSYCKSTPCYNNSTCTSSIAYTLFCDCFLVEEHLVCLSFYGINFIISGSGDGSVRIWNYRTGTCERCLQGHTGTVWSLTRKKDILITGSHDKTVSKREREKERTTIMIYLYFTSSTLPLSVSPYRQYCGI